MVGVRGGELGGELGKKLLMRVMHELRSGKLHPPKKLRARVEEPCFRWGGWVGGGAFNEVRLAGGWRLGGCG